MREQGGSHADKTRQGRDIAVETGYRHLKYKGRARRLAQGTQRPAERSV